MKLETFLVKAILRNIQISSRTEHGWPWHNYCQHAELTSMVDFQCNFDKNGLCKKRWTNEKPTKAELRRASMCCCTGCRSTIGHMRNLPNSIGMLREISALYNNRTGFWRAGEGCILPRKYRSLTCLFYRCDVKFEKDHPLILLESMMYTRLVRDRYDNLSFPKTVKAYYAGKNHRWVPYKELLGMFEKQAKKEKSRKKRKVSNGDN